MIETCKKSISKFLDGATSLLKGANKFNIQLKTHYCNFGPLRRGLKTRVILASQDDQAASKNNQLGWVILHFVYDVG
jgi:hypothetical protein